jgi:hypothetical protein
MQLRVKLAIAAFAGVGAAWLFPRGGSDPPPAPSPTSSDRPGVTAETADLATIPEGISFRVIDGVRVFLVRAGTRIIAFEGRATTAADGPLYWCPTTGVFESDGGVVYDRNGLAIAGPAERHLTGIGVVVGGDRVTIFPHTTTRGTTVAGLPAQHPTPCSPGERLG